jgi:hypothetical protein
MARDAWRIPGGESRLKTQARQILRIIKARTMRQAAGADTMQLVLYSKAGCHLCEGLQEKLAAIAHLNFSLEVRDITSRSDWFAAYQYEIPVLCRVITTADGLREEPLPRLSPRAPVAQLERLIQTYLNPDQAK